MVAKACHAKERATFAHGVGVPDGRDAEPLTHPPRSRPLAKSRDDGLRRRSVGPQAVLATVFQSAAANATIQDGGVYF